MSPGLTASSKDASISFGALPRHLTAILRLKARGQSAYLPKISSEVESVIIWRRVRPVTYGVHEQIWQDNGAVLLQNIFGGGRNRAVGSFSDQLGLDPSGVARVELGLERRGNKNVAWELQNGIRVFYLEERKDGE